MRYQINDRIVTIGGGTGSFTMLSELKKVAARLWAIVAMTDSGGSSRRLIDEFGRPLPLGDLRQALVALSRSSRLWADLFMYRFPIAAEGHEVVGGHALGNLILHALQDNNGGDLLAAIEDAEELLNTAGHVIPVTLDPATLCAALRDGTVVCGEGAIDVPGNRSLAPIERVYIEPRATATLRARKALERADMILIGPGDLFTSIVPCLLVEGIPEAVQASDAEIVYICNVMTKLGETEGYKASDYVRQIHHYLGRRVDTVLVDTSDYPPELLARYRAEGAEPVEPDLPAVRALVPRVLSGPFAVTEQLIRHDAERVLLAIWPDLAR